MIRDSARAGLQFAVAMLIHGVACGVRNAVTIAFEEVDREAQRYGIARDEARGADRRRENGAVWGPN